MAATFVLRAWPSPSYVLSERSKEHIPKREFAGGRRRFCAALLERSKGNWRHEISRRVSRLFGAGRTVRRVADRSGPRSSSLGAGGVSSERTALPRARQSPAPGCTRRPRSPSQRRTHLQLRGTFARR